MTGTGIGGPNAHFALALLDALDEPEVFPQSFVIPMVLTVPQKLPEPVSTTRPLKNRGRLGSIIGMPFAAKMRTLSFDL